MFSRVILTQLKICLRSKKYIFWTLAFPLALGTLFVFAFSSIYESEKSKSIPVIIETEDAAYEEFQKIQIFSSLDTDKIKSDLESYEEEKAIAEATGKEFSKEAPISADTLDALEEVNGFDDIKNFDIDLIPKEYIKEEVKVSEDELPFIKLMNTLEYENGNPMIERKYADSHEDAVKLLEDGDIAGIITVSSLQDVKLLVNGEGTNHSILSNIISEYRLNVDLTISSANKNTEHLNELDDQMDNVITNIDYIHESGTSGKNKDPFIQYFYNLIAMVCIMGAIASMNSIVSDQANQSTVGIRLDVSPANKTLYELAQLIAITIIQTAIVFIALLYLIFVHKINFGGDLKMIFFTSFVADLAGIILGYFVAHMGKAGTDKKEAILMVFVLGGGFLAGLMMGDMKIKIEENFPLFNRINPSAVITDAFYSLNVFGVGPRYYRALAYLTGLSLVMFVLGVLMSRKNSYKSL